MASLWRGNPTVADLNRSNANTIHAPLGIEFTEIGEDFIRARMPVDQRTHQPFGLLHGGASVVLAESLGSTATFLNIDTEKFGAVGIEVNANHVRGVKSGLVTGTVRPLHVGRSTQLWDIRIEDEAGKLLCVARLTVAVIPKVQ
ncbi:MAG: hotdog fold thioesterase [Betaproteobacteria bacterium]|nr:hotdog fold thioesterase [Betaproteobacteria bacterium]